MSLSLRRQIGGGFFCSGAPVAAPLYSLVSRTWKGYWQRAAGLTVDLMVAIKPDDMEAASNDYSMDPSMFV